MPHEPALLSELANRCIKTDRAPVNWLRVFRLLAPSPGAGPVPQGPQCGGTSRLANTEKPIPPPVSANEARGGAAAKVAWTLPKIADLLDHHRQRATYGAVAGILRVLPLGVMSGRTKSPGYSWIVAASGPDRGKPTGYSDHQVHPECLRQIHEGRGRVITRSEELRDRLHRSA